MTTIDTQDFTGTIVVGTDGSAAADRAIELAAKRAARDHTPLTLLTVVSSLPIPSRSKIFHELRDGIGPAEMLERMRAKASARLEDIANDVRDDHPGLDVSTLIIEGEPARVLAEATKTARFTVVGARGESAPIRERILGGTADALVSQAYGPVVVVPEFAPRFATGPVVVGLDASTESAVALQLAVSECHASGADLVIVHAWDPTPVFGATMAAVFDTGDDLEAEIRSFAEPYLDGLPPERVRYDVSAGHAAGKLIEHSRSAVIVIMGSRGRGGFAGLLLGSVSRAVLHESICPVMVTRAERRKKGEKTDKE